MTRFLSFKRFLELFGQGGDDLEEVADDSVSGDFEDGGIGVFVDGNDDFGRLHTD